MKFRYAFCAAALASLIGAGQAPAQEKTFELKLSLRVPASDPLQ
jgi:hypothetical protein